MPFSYGLFLWHGVAMILRRLSKSPCAVLDTCHPCPTCAKPQISGRFACRHRMTCWEMCHVCFCLRFFVCARFFVRPQAPGAGHPARLASPHKRRRAVARWLACGSRHSKPSAERPDTWRSCAMELRSTARSAARATARPQARQGRGNRAPDGVRIKKRAPKTHTNKPLPPHPPTPHHPPPSRPSISCISGQNRYVPRFPSKALEIRAGGRPSGLPLDRLT
ncbi:hypothetical protein MTsPCn3_29070 [Erythrobacter sp. MTPC3]